jgi:predicted PurR-regulated permease PerM
MLGLDRNAARWTWTAILILLLCRALYQIRETIFILIIAILFAYMLTPLVNVLNHHLPGKSRTPGLAITYVLLIGFLAIVGIELGTRVAEEATSLATKAPEFFGHLSGATFNVPLPHYLEMLRGDVLVHIQTFLQTHSGDIVSYLPTAGLKVISYSSYLLFLVLVPVISFFLLKDGSEIYNHTVTLFPDGSRRQMWIGIIADTHILLGQYVRAMGLLCLITFVVFAIVFSILGVPYGILLAAIAFPLEFIPMIGPLIAAVIIILVSIATGYGHVFGIVIFLGLYRLCQDYVVSPRLMSSGVEVHPLLVILGVLAGEKLGGVPGMFLSVPAVALIRVVYRRLRSSMAPVSQPLAESRRDHLVI